MLHVPYKFRIATTHAVGLEDNLEGDPLVARDFQRRQMERHLIIGLFPLVFLGPRQVLYRLVLMFLDLRLPYGEMD